MLRLVEQALDAVERLRELVAEGAVVEQAGEQPRPGLDLEGDPLQALRGADQRSLETAAVRGVAGELAEDPLAALHPPEDGVERVGDHHDVVHHVLARGDQGVDVGGLRRPDLSLLGDRRVGRRAGVDVDVLVPQQADGLDPRPRRGLLREHSLGIGREAQPRRVVALDAEPDADRLLPRVLGEHDLLDRPHVDAVELHRAAGLEPRDRAELHEVAALVREEVALRADHEDPHRQDENGGEDHQADADLAALRRHARAPPRVPRGRRGSRPAARRRSARPPARCRGRPACRRPAGRCGRPPGGPGGCRG